MRVGLLITLVTGFLIFNLYHDGKYTAILKSWKKYYQMAGIAFIGLSLYLFIRKQPHQTASILQSASNFVKYMPLDKGSADVLSPMLRMGAGAMGTNDSPSREQRASQKIMSSGGNSTKRCVSESKKKFVAASQDWKCKHCNDTLKAWFEVDHIVRLQNGGSNHIDNLVALCRECHGKKTMTENFS